MPRLRPQPDWTAASQALVAALEAQPSPAGRVEVIESCRDALGDVIYPTFVKLLAAVGCFADAGAKELTAEALAEALATARLPSVRVPAWGGASTPAPDGRPALLTNSRSVGPIEFLCLWTRRLLVAEPLTPEAFETCLTWLIELLDASPRAAKLYQAKLSGADFLEGLHDPHSRELVRTLVTVWEAGASPPEVARQAREVLR